MGRRKKRETDRRKKHLHRTAYVISVLLALAVGALAFRYGRYHSGNALLSQARDEAAAGQYSKAAKTIGHVISLRDSRVEISAQQLLLMKADYEYNAGEYSDAAASAAELVSETSADSDLSGQAAEITVNSCKKSGNYEKLAAFLHDYKDRPFADTYLSYMCETPDISPGSGTYAEDTKITIKGGKGGSVYYTTDRSDPSTGGLAYKDSFSLKKGRHEVRAVYVNSYGVTSSVASEWITVVSSKPDPPSVTPESGIYTSAARITAQGQEGCEIRYTDDDTEPGSSSKLYEDPIEMPAGNTTFRFVCVTEDGVISDETAVTYSFRSKKMPSVSDGSDLIREALSEQAVSLVKEELAAGKTLDEIRGQGPSSDTQKEAKEDKKKTSSPSQEEILLASYSYYNPASYYYSYETEVTVNGRTYYVYEENYVDSTGGGVKTKDRYAVDTGTSEIYGFSGNGASSRLKRISDSDVAGTDGTDTSDTAAAAGEP